MAQQVVCSTRCGEGPGTGRIGCCTQPAADAAQPAADGSAVLAHLQHNTRVQQHLPQHMAGCPARVTWCAPSNKTFW